MSFWSGLCFMDQTTILDLLTCDVRYCFAWDLGFILNTVSGFRCRSYFLSKNHERMYKSVALCFAYPKLIAPHDLHWVHS